MVNKPLKRKERYIIHYEYYFEVLFIYENIIQIVFIMQIFKILFIMNTI